MSDTPDKPKNPFLEGKEEPSEKKSPWFVTPMGDKKDARPDDKQAVKEGQDAQKIKSQPAEDQKSEPAEKPATQPKPAEPPAASKPAAPKPAAQKPAAPKPATPRPAASKPSPAKTPRSGPKTTTVAGLTIDDEDAPSKVSTPMLVVDALAAVVALTFMGLILHDLWPFF